MCIKFYHQSSFAKTPLICYNRPKQWGHLSIFFIRYVDLCLQQVWFFHAQVWRGVSA
jgi:hypothetical protein